MILGDDVDPKDANFSFLSALKDGKLHLNVDMVWPKKVIMDELNAVVDRTLKAMKEMGIKSEETRRRLKEWKVDLLVYDMRKADLSFLQISEKLDDLRETQDGDPFLDENTVRQCYNRAVELIEKGGYRKIR